MYMMLEKYAEKIRNIFFENASLSHVYPVIDDSHCVEKCSLKSFFSISNNFNKCLRAVKMTEKIESTVV